jgi:hypothetical protein
MLGDWMKGDRPTASTTKTDSRTPKTLKLKLSNKHRNEMKGN